MKSNFRPVIFILIWLNFDFLKLIYIFFLVFEMSLLEFPVENKLKIKFLESQNFNLNFLTIKSG